MNRKKWLIGALIGVWAVSVLIDGFYYRRGITSMPVTADLAGILSVFLLVLWIEADSKDHPQVERCFDYGSLLLVFWLPYLPYYL